MFRADGQGVRANVDGTVTVKVAFIDDGTNAVLFTREVTGKDIADVTAQVTAQLTSLATAKQDVLLNQQFVGKTLASI